MFMFSSLNITILNTYVKYKTYQYISKMYILLYTVIAEDTHLIPYKLQESYSIIYNTKCAMWHGVRTTVGCFQRLGKIFLYTSTDTIMSNRI